MTLLVEVSKIPPDGMSVTADLDASSIHIERGDGFELRGGGCLRCRVEKAEGQTVHVQGHLSAAVSLECGRCLERFSLPLEQDLDLFFLRHEEDRQLPEDEVELSERDMVVAYYQNDQVDLGEIVREHVFLTIPMRRLCREDCQGICPTCGANRNTTQCSCSDDSIDPRLMPLKQLLDRGSE